MGQQLKLMSYITNAHTSNRFCHHEYPTVDISLCNTSENGLLLSSTGGQSDAWIISSCICSYLQPVASFK